MGLKFNFGNGELFLLNLKYFRDHFDTMQLRRKTTDKEIESSLFTFKLLLHCPLVAMQ